MSIGFFFLQITIPPHHYALMLLRLTTPEEEGLYSGIVHLETQYHIEKYEAVLKAVEGYVSIKPEKVAFLSGYPVSLPICHVKVNLGGTIKHQPF